MIRRGFATSLVACLLAGTGCKAAPPGKLETSVMTRAKRLLFVGNKKEKSPLQFTPDNWQQGKTAFSHYCMVCHGLDGQNTGVPFADRMSPPVPRLSSKDVQAYSDGQLKWVIDNGISPSGMPGSKGILNDEEIWSIVLYLRHLPPGGSVGEPAVYTGDCDQPGESGTEPAGKEPQ
jgi:cytochrome c553